MYEPCMIVLYKIVVNPSVYRPFVGCRFFIEKLRYECHGDFSMKGDSTVSLNLPCHQRVLREVYIDAHFAL